MFLKCRQINWKTCNVFHISAKLRLEGLQIYLKCAPLQVFSKDFAQIYSYLLRFLNISEASILQNNFWLVASNHPYQFSRYSNRPKLYIQDRWPGAEEPQGTFNLSSGNLIVLTWQKAWSNCNMLLQTPCPSARVRCAPVASPVDNFAESASPVSNYVSPANKLKS